MDVKSLKDLKEMSSFSGNGFEVWKGQRMKAMIGIKPDWHEVENRKRNKSRKREKNRKESPNDRVLEKGMEHWKLIRETGAKEKERKLCTMKLEQWLSGTWVWINRLGIESLSDGLGNLRVWERLTSYLHWLLSFAFPLSDPPAVW